MLQKYWIVSVLGETELIFYHRQSESNKLRFSYPQFVSNKLTFIEHLRHARYVCFTQNIFLNSHSKESPIYTLYPDEKTKAQSTTWYNLPNCQSKEYV